MHKAMTNVRDREGSESQASEVAGVDDFNIHEPSRKRRRTDAGVDGNGIEQERSWVVKTGQWRLRVRNVRNGDGSTRGGVECVLVGVRIDAFSGEYGRNSQKGFLGG